MRKDNTIQKSSLIGASAVYLVFTISGASALVYQVVWARWLGLVFGNTTLSISIVLGSFMMGLALGSWLAGRSLHRIENPMRYYAFMELGIGTFALLFPVFTKLSDLLFTTFMSSESLTGYSVFIRAVLSAMVLIVPTTFMGATFPLLTDFFHRSPKHTQSWKVGLLYAANTLGAAIGIAVASFILIELIGILATTLIAAGLNFIVAWLGYRFSLAPELLRSELTPPDERRLAGPAIFAVAVIAVSGCLALASEVLWTRTLETIIGNSTYAFATMLLVYLIGIGAGSWIMSLLVNRLKALPLWIATMLLGMGLWMVISVRLFESIGASIAAYSFKMVPLSTVFGHYLYAMWVIFPLSLLSGACFPLATRIMDPKSEDAKGVLVAKAYSWNTVGALVGSLAAGFIIAPFWDYLTSLYLLASLYCFAAIVSYAVIGVSKWQIPYKMQIAALMGLLSVTFFVSSFINAEDHDYFVKRFDGRHPSEKLVFHEPGLQGITSVTKNLLKPNREVLLVNGLGMTVKTTDTKMMAHLPMLIHPNPENTLVICFGMGTTYRSAVSYGKKVTVAELVKEVVDTFDYFYKDASIVRAYSGGKIVVNDGRNFLKITRANFDVITIDPPPPIDAAGVNNLYSKEFIELAKKHLNEGGIMAQWMPLPGSGSGVDDVETIKMLIRTFAQVFPYTYIHKSFDGNGLHVIGSMEPIDISSKVVRDKLSNKAVSDDINEWQGVPFDFFIEGWELLPPKNWFVGPVITDNEPHLEFYLLRTLRRGGKKMHPISNFW
ncbi:MAG: fused MFS/spermidine synthase [Dissulfurispiraceae bacterium]